MAIRAICVGLLLFGSLGCGTVKNTVLTPPQDGGKTPFGGVREDMQGMRNTKQNSQPALSVLCAVDLPFSAVGDLLTLPYTYGYTVINEPVPSRAIDVIPFTPSDSPAPSPVLPTLPPPASSTPTPLPR